MSTSVRSPWLLVWLALVLLAGTAYSFSVRADSSLLPGDRLLFAGVVLIVLGGAIGGVRTGRLFSWQAPVPPTRFEWYLGLTGLALFVAPLLHLALFALANLAWPHAL
jgi:hypothetical protein